MHPARVADHYEHWGHAPPALSPRCVWWVKRIRDGWRPNKRVGGLGYDSSAQFYGVWIWEYLHVLSPLMYGFESARSHGDADPAALLAAAGL